MRKQNQESQIADACDLAHTLSKMYGPGKSRANNIERLVAGVLRLEKRAAAFDNLLAALKALMAYEPVREVLAPTESLGSLRAQAEAAIAKAEAQ